MYCKGTKLKAFCQIFTCLFPSHHPFVPLHQKSYDMATSIITDFESINLTAHLPEEVSFETDAESLEISIFVNGSKVFTSKYYPYNDEVTIRDIRSIVEAYMRDRRLNLATLKIVATEPKESKPDVTYDEDGNIHMEFGNEDEEPVTETVDNIKIVYSRFKTTELTNTFLASSFLTNRKSALLPRNGLLKLAYYTRANAKENCQVTIFYSPKNDSETIYTFSNTTSITPATKDLIDSVHLSHQTFKSAIDLMRKTNCNVRGVEYQIGNRHFNFFFTDEQPTDVFTFLNAFNIEERAYLYGATTIKTEIDRSEAVCGNETQFYDETLKVKNEVETAPLPYDEAKWLSQMLTSKKVSRAMGDGTFEEILISDITSEVSDSDKDLIRLKFSWKYADGSQWL